MYNQQNRGIAGNGGLVFYYPAMLYELPKTAYQMQNKLTFDTYWLQIVQALNDFYNLRQALLNSNCMDEGSLRTAFQDIIRALKQYTDWEVDANLNIDGFLKIIDIQNRRGECHDV